MENLLFLALAESTITTIVYVAIALIGTLLGYIIKDFKNNNQKDLNSAVKQLTDYIDSKHQETLTRYEGLEKRINKIDGGEDIEGGRLGKIDHQVENIEKAKDKNQFELQHIIKNMASLESKMTDMSKELASLAAFMNTQCVSRSEFSTTLTEMRQLINSVNDQLGSAIQTQHRILVDIAKQEKRLTGKHYSVR